MKKIRDFCWRGDGGDKSLEQQEQLHTPLKGLCQAYVVANPAAGLWRLWTSKRLDTWLFFLERAMEKIGLVALIFCRTLLISVALFCSGGYILVGANRVSTDC